MLGIPRFSLSSDEAGGTENNQPSRVSLKTTQTSNWSHTKGQLCERGEEWKGKAGASHTPGGNRDKPAAEALRSPGGRHVGTGPKLFHPPKLTETLPPVQVVHTSPQGQLRPPG